MPIEFICPTCQQTLRVPDDAVGKNARCPKCNAVAVVPGAGPAPVAPPSGSGGASPFSPAPFAPSPFASNPAPAPGTNPSWAFGAGGAAGGGNPFSPTSAGANPYASPQPLPFQPSLPVLGSDIRNQQVGVDPIFKYAWQIWQQNLGLLVGTTITALGINWAIGLVIGGTQGAMEQNGATELANLIGLVGNLAANAVGIFLGIGQAQIALKLARGQRAEYAELFKGGSRFWPVLGGSILAGVAFVLGLLLLIVPAIILALVFWPFYYVIVDRKADVMDSFTLASKITEGNKGTTFVLWLLSIVISLVGLLALCVGIFFAAPLVTMMWAVAYLMMSGQLPPYAPAAGQFQPTPPTPQPWPSKP